MITTPENSPVQVRISTPAGVTPAVDQTVTVTPGQTTVVPLDGDLRIAGGTGVSSSGVLVEATGGNVNVASVNQGSCAAYLSLPVKTMGTEYYAMTWDPNTSGGLAEIGVVALYSNVQLTVVLPMGSGASITLNGITFTEGSTLSVTLKIFQTLNLEASQDLTGTLIKADYPIAVYSGNRGVSIDGTNTDNTVSQMIPVLDYGTVFTSAPLPNAPEKGYIKILASEDLTNVNVPGQSATYQLNAGEFTTIEVSPASYLSLQSDHPILATYYTTSGSGSGHFPSALLLPAQEHFLTSFYFTVLPDTVNKTYDNYLVIIIDFTQLAGLLLDGVQVESTYWSSVPELVLASKAINITDGVHELTHNDPSIVFGAYVYGISADDCTYASPAGMLLTDKGYMLVGLPFLNL